MTDGPVTGAVTAQGDAPNGANPSSATSAATSASDDQVQQDLFNLVNQNASTGSDAPGTAQSGTQGPPSDGADLASQLAHWKEMSRKNEARAKENADKARQFDSIQESQKTELQKATERAERAEKLAADATAERIRVAAGAKHQIPSELMEFLTGATEEEIESQAQRLASVIASRNGNGNGQPQRPSGQRPIESLRPGSAPSTSSTGPQNPDQIFRDLLSGR